MFPRKHASFLKGVLTSAFLLFVLTVGIYLLTKSPVPEVLQEYQWLELTMDAKHTKRKSDTIQCIINSKHDILLPGRRFLLIVLSHDEKSERKAKRWCMCRPWTRMLRVTSSVFFESMVYKDITSILDAESRVQPLDYVALASYRSVQMLPVEKLQTLLHLLEASKVCITVTFLQSNSLHSSNHNRYRYQGHLDVVPLMNYGFPLMSQAIAAHTTAFQVAWDTLLLSMGYSQTDIRAVDGIEVFLRNSFITRLVCETTSCMLAVFHPQPLVVLFSLVLLGCAKWHNSCQWL